MSHPRKHLAFDGTRINETKSRAGTARTNQTWIADDMSSFAWTDLDLREVLSQEARGRSHLAYGLDISCGALKCFFHAKKEKGVGFVVSPRWAKRKQVGGLSWYLKMHSAWTLTKDFKARFGSAFRHFNLGPPVMKGLRQSADLKSTDRIFLLYPMYYAGRKSQSGPSVMQLTVQKVWAAPSPNFVIKVGVGSTMLEPWTSFLRSSVTDRAGFLQKFKSGLAASLSMAHQEPCLLTDFQIMVDKAGAVYQVDIDRCLIKIREAAALENLVMQEMSTLLNLTSGILSSTLDEEKRAGASSAAADAKTEDERLLALAMPGWKPGTRRPGNADTLIAMQRKLEEMLSAMAAQKTSDSTDSAAEEEEGAHAALTRHERPPRPPRAARRVRRRRPRR